MEEKKLIVKPQFYDKFSCIGGACDFTCCKEWKISVDDETAEKWRNTPIPNAAAVRIQNDRETSEVQGKKCLFDLTKYWDETRAMALRANHRCPLLNEDDLCDTVITYGDGMLSETCRIFPREQHVFADRIEKVLMPCCPAVIDLFAWEEAPAIILEGKGSREGKSTPDRHEAVRDYLMNLNVWGDGSLGETLSASFYLLGEFDRNQNLTVEEARANEKEIISLIHDFDIDPKDVVTEDLELFLDLSENYRKQGLYEEYLEEKADLAEDILADCECDPERFTQWMNLYKNEFQQEMKRFGKIFRNWIYYEIYADLMHEDSSFLDMQIRLQWIAMEYAFMRTWCFLHFAKNKRMEYENVRTAIVLGSRMMGYEEDDILEYLENSFESLNWEMGYFALIVRE